MDEARVVINLKEGIIELQGPVDFVRHYLDTYQFAIKDCRIYPRILQVSEQKAKASPRKRKEVPRSRAGNRNVLRARERSAPICRKASSMNRALPEKSKSA